LFLLFCFVLFLFRFLFLVSYFLFLVSCTSRGIYCLCFFMHRFHR
jgi:hypothetical protein